MKPLALLILPPVYDFALYDLYIKPYGLLRIGRWLKRNGYRISFINALSYRDHLSNRIYKKPRRMSDGTGKFYRRIIEKPSLFKDLKRNYARYGIVEESLKDKIKEQKPDIILIGSGMTYWYPGVKETVELCRKMYPRVPVIVGGVYATLLRKHAERILDADAVISGDAYPAVNSVLKKLSMPVPLAPLEDKPLVLEELYSDAAVIRINTGCPFRCRYCASYLLSGGFRSGRWRSVFHFIKEIHEQLGTVNFAFYDDALLIEKEEQLIPFLEQIIDSGLSLNFYVPNGVHLSSIDELTASLMFRAGFKEVRLGFESSSSDFHKSADKKLDIDELKRGVAILKKAGFSGSRIGVYLLAGLPRQYMEEVEESIYFVSQFGVKIFIAEYSPVPGTELFKESVKASVFPIDEEPLFHNNTILPMRWEGFTLEELDYLKTLARSLSPK
ncbi:MAG: radical SAM protein [Spirochaetales bacterium]|nr:radical SAM protein [Spirochaetales bacterium]